MTIDPDWLGEVVELMTGRAYDGDAARALAPVLGEVEEVLPWLVLRQGALADEPEIVQELRPQLGRDPADDLDGRVDFIREVFDPLAERTAARGR